MIVKAKELFKSRVVKNIFWLSFDKVFKLFIGLIAGIWVARYLGPVNFGKLNYILAFISIVVTLSNLGLDSFLIKEILERPEEKKSLIGTAFRLRFVAVVIFSFLVAGALCLLDLPKEYYSIYLILLITVVVTPFDIIDIEYQSQLRSRRTVIAKNIAYACGAVFKLSLIYIRAPFIWFVWSVAIETLLASCILILFYLQEQRITDWGFKQSYAIELLIKGWPFILSGISVILYMRIDQIMLGYFLGSKSVGEFSAAVRITEVFHFIPMAIISSYYSTLIRSKSEGNEKGYEKKIKTLFNWSFLVSFILALVITLFAQPIIIGMFGALFKNSILILQIHVWSLIAVFLGVAATPYLVISNLQKISLYKTVIGLVANLVLNFILIPKYAAVGAAVSTLIAYFISAIFSNLFFRNTRKVFVYQYLSVKNLLLFKKNEFLI